MITESIKKLEEDIQKYVGSQVEVLIMEYLVNSLLIVIKSKSQKYFIDKKFIDTFIDSFKSIEYKNNDVNEFEKSIQLKINYKKLNDNQPCVYEVSFVTDCV